MVVQCLIFPQAITMSLSLEISWGRYLTLLFHPLFLVALTKSTIFHRFASIIMIACQANVDLYKVNFCRKARGTLLRANFLISNWEIVVRINSMIEMILAKISVKWRIVSNIWSLAYRKSLLHSLKEKILTILGQLRWKKKRTM